MLTDLITMDALVKVLVVLVVVVLMLLIFQTVLLASVVGDLKDFLTWMKRRRKK